MGPTSTKIAPAQHQTVKWFTTRTGVQLRINYLEPSLPTASTTDDANTASQNGINSPDIKYKQNHVKPSDSTKAIFFIHGVAGSSDIWSSQIRYFTERGYYVIAPDLLGHGYSHAPDNAALYKFECLSKDCLDIFDQMHKDVNVVVGHSYGTSFAAYLAYNRTSRVEKLVLMSGGAPVALAPQTGILSLPTPFLSCLKPVLTRFFNRNAFHKKSRNIPNRSIAFDVPIYVLRHTMKGQVWEEGGEIFHRSITQPTLLLHGEGDRLESTDGTIEMKETLQRPEFHVIPEAGHMVMMEQPLIVNSLIDKFASSSQIIHVSNAQQKVSSSHTQLTKSQPNLRRATLSGQH